MIGMSSTTSMAEPRVLWLTRGALTNSGDVGHLGYYQIEVYCLFGQQIRYLAASEGDH
jgi:hypothetical protein